MYLTARDQTRSASLTQERLIQGFRLTPPLLSASAQCRKFSKACERPETGAKTGRMNREHFLQDFKEAALKTLQTLKNSLKNAYLGIGLLAVL